MAADAPYFPNVPGQSMQIEMRLRTIARDLPEPLRCQLYEILSEAHDQFQRTAFALEDTALVADQLGRRIGFPRPLPMVKFSHILCGYEQWLERKYCLPDFLGVEPGDVVVDCGAYVGGFSLSAIKLASQLHAFEPERANFSCLARNLAGHPNATLNELGLYSKTETKVLNVSISGVEHSLLTPDDGQPIERREIPVVALQDYCKERSIARIDFLKLEAEGVELEIFEGLGELRPRKLAIDVSPEREGQSPAEDFRTILTPLGYDIRQRGHVMFARLA